MFVPLVGQAEIDCDHREKRDRCGQRYVGCQENVVKNHRGWIDRSIENRVAIISEVVCQVAGQKHDRDEKTADHRQFMSFLSTGPNQRVTDDQQDERQCI